MIFKFPYSQVQILNDKVRKLRDLRKSNWLVDSTGYSELEDELRDIGHNHKLVQLKFVNHLVKSRSHLDSIQTNVDKLKTLQVNEFIKFIMACLDKSENLSQEHSDIELDFAKVVGQMDSTLRNVKEIKENVSWFKDSIFTKVIYGFINTIKFIFTFIQVK